MVWSLQGYCEHRSQSSLAPALPSKSPCLVFLGWEVYLREVFVFCFDFDFDFGSTDLLRCMVGLDRSKLFPADAMMCYGHRSHDRPHHGSLVCRSYARICGLGCGCSDHGYGIRLVQVWRYLLTRSISMFSNTLLPKADLWFTMRRTSSVRRTVSAVGRSGS